MTKSGGAGDVGNDDGGCDYVVRHLARALVFASVSFSSSAAVAVVLDADLYCKRRNQHLRW